MPLARRALSLSIWLSIAILAPATLAQIPPSSSTTSTPVPGAGHDYLGAPAETVNPVSGSVSIRLPVIMPPGRGITLPFSFAYDSNGVNYLSRNSGGIEQWFTTNSIVSSGGWSNSAPVMSMGILRWKTTSGASQPLVPLINQVSCTAYVAYVFQDARGNRHNLGLTTYSDPGGTGPCTFNSNDWPPGFDGEVVLQGGEGPILATLPSSPTLAGHVTVTDGDGTQFGFAGQTGFSTFMASSVTDRNGNSITINPPSTTNLAFNYVDTAGRTVLQDSGFTISPETVTISGLGAPYTLTWTSLSTPTFSTPITTLFGTCNAPTHTSWLGTHALSALTLPNGKSFSFNYDATYGLLQKMTYPTGGYVRYVWG